MDSLIRAAEALQANLVRAAGRTAPGDPNVILICGVLKTLHKVKP